MKVIAHRGACKEAQENSYTAYRKAVAIGAQGIEVDAHLSNDGEVFLVHDPGLESAAGLNTKVEQSSSQELAQVVLRNGETLPSLRTTLSEFAQKVRLTIELKSQGEAIVDAVVACMVQQEAVAQVTVSSFELHHLEYLRDRYPNIARAVVWSPYELWHRPAHLNVPEFLMEHLDCQEIWPRYDHVDEAFMEQARQKGWTVIPWLPYETDDRALQKEKNFWGNLVDWKVDGLCTNFPRELTQWLSQTD